MAELPARPTREHALQVAEELFVGGRRLDMGSLSHALGIGRTTLYRWVGDREQLLGVVLASLADRTWVAVRAQARGEGVERAIDAVRRFVEVTADFPPLRSFAERESQLALRVLCSPDSVVPARIAAGIHAAFTDNVPAAEVPSPELVDIMVQVGTALEWTPIVIGQPPAVERAITLMRWLLRAPAPAGA